MEVFMSGGWSYSIGDPEVFDNIREACETWADRMASNGVRPIDGVLYPCWGDASDEEYVIATEFDGLTKSEVLAVAEGGEVPFGW